jgi:hypothetical protein
MTRWDTVAYATRIGRPARPPGPRAPTGNGLQADLSTFMGAAGAVSTHPVSQSGARGSSSGVPDHSQGFEARHAAIIARTLRWADEAAARDDYAEALRWVETIDRLGEALPEAYETKRRAWRNALGRRPTASS